MPRLTGPAREAGLLAKSERAVDHQLAGARQGRPECGLVAFLAVELRLLSLLLGTVELLAAQAEIAVEFELKLARPALEQSAVVAPSRGPVAWKNATLASGSRVMISRRSALAIVAPHTR